MYVNVVYKFSCARDLYITVVTMYKLYMNYIFLGSIAACDLPYCPIQLFIILVFD